MNLQFGKSSIKTRRDLTVVTHLLGDLFAFNEGGGEEKKMSWFFL